VGETERLLQVYGTESPEFQIAADFILSSLAMSTQGADTDFISAAALLQLRNEHTELTETHGEEDAKWIIARVLNNEINYLETSSSDAGMIARQLKAAFENSL